jgi:small subunit ribosomal protein S18
MRCPLCARRVAEVDYKDVDLLRRFLTTRNQIARRSRDPRCKRGNVCRLHQRQLAIAIKRARFMALLPARPGPKELRWPPPERKPRRR